MIALLLQLLKKKPESSTAENLKLKGRLDLELRDQYGRVKKKRTVYNLIVNVGFTHITDSVFNHTGSRPNVMSHTGVGTGTNAAAAGDTALQTQTLRKTGSATWTVGTKTLVFESTYNAGEATAALTEAGVFNAASAGTMLNRVVFSAINKGALDVLTVRFTFTLA